MEKKIILAYTDHDNRIYIHHFTHICRSIWTRTTHIPIHMKIFLKNIWKKWLKLGEYIGNIVGSIIIYIFYYTLFLFPGIYFTILKDKLGKKYNDKTYSTYFEEPKDVNIYTIEEARELA